MTINIIDPHLHFFSLKHGYYHWLKPENPPFWPDKSIIHRDFLLDDLLVTLRDDLNSTLPIKLSGLVHIEAGFDNERPEREIGYIENLGFQKSATIASINLLAPTSCFKNQLAVLLEFSSFVGVRHILDEQAYQLLSSKNVQNNFRELNKVPYCIFELQLPLCNENIINVMPLLCETIAENNQLSFIINHAGFPPRAFENQQRDLWQKNIRALAQFNNVYIKCSGMEMVDRQYDMAWFSDITQFCLASFSHQRVMLASNFPLCLFSKASYVSYWQDILNSCFFKQLDGKKKQALLHNNALKIYFQD
jgi:predicted TIM-barrel fold metal-dependent hydrolase